MRAKEFINEATMHPWHSRCIPGMKSFSNIGQYYDIYRFGLMLAAAGRSEDPILGDPDGVTEDSPTTLSYTQADEDIINTALKKMGRTARQITTRISAEPLDTNKISPIIPKGPIKRKT